METKQLSDLKGSEKLKIQAAVLEIMETKGFSLDKDLGIVESQADSNSWIMAFTNKVSAFEDLELIKQKLGVKFKVQITSKSKENFLFRVEAPSEEFIRLGQTLKPLQLPSDVLPPRSTSTSSVQPSRSEYQTHDREP
ncbi:MAG: hypothetical protein ACI3Y0_05065 [Prevotella sp.]